MNTTNTFKQDVHSRGLCPGFVADLCQATQYAGEALRKVVSSNPKTAQEPLFKPIIQKLFS